MARLNHAIYFSFLTSPGANDGVVRFEVAANNTGTPEARVYLDGGAAPAYTVMVPNFFVPYSYTKGALAPGTYVVEYKDDLGERIVGKVILPVDPEPCALGATISPTGSVLVNDTMVRVKLPYSQTEASINDGVNYKTIVSEIATWSNSEIAALGLTDELLGVHYRKTTVANLKNIEGFEESTYPGFSGPSWTLVDMTASTTSGLAVGMNLQFFGSNLYNSGTIVAIPGPDYVVIQHSFVGTETGVTAGIQSSCTYEFITDFLIETLLTPLAATFTQTNVTTYGGSDGSIQIIPSGGSGNYSYLWGDGSTAQNRTGLFGGTYTVTVTDITTTETVELEITITQPAAPVHVGSYFKVPSMNSLHYVIDETVNECTTFQGLDNKLFCQQIHPFFEMANYYQKVCTCDAPVTQYYSDFASVLVELKNYITGATVRTYTPELKEENIGIVETFALTIRAHTVSGKSRVYFNVGAPPIPLEVGDNFTIVNNLDGFNGAYTIVDIITDTILGYQYLVINKLYDLPALTSAASGEFTASAAEFNVYEFASSMIGLPDGHYQMKITVFDDDVNFRVAYSEPILLQVTHPGTHIIKYRNFDNAFDLTFTTGYIGQVRVESVFFKRMPGGERSMSRNSDFSLVKVLARKQRIILFETFMLPPYLHEKLSVIFDMDFFSVNDVECQASEGYGEPQYLVRYPLANSSIKLETVGWFDRYNSDDIGSVNDGGLVALEGGYLKI